MSFGFGISDIALLIQLAWSTFDGAKRACGEHDDLTKEVLSLHSILNHLRSEVRNPKSLINLAAENRRMELDNHLRGCGRHLRRMNSVLTKFNALPDEERSGKQLWQRIRFGNGAVKDVADIRLKMSTYTTAISMTLNLLSLGSQGRVEQRLIRQGGELTGITESINLLVAKLTASSPEGSIMTTYSNDDKAFWRALRRELVEDGYPSKVIQSHKVLIQDYVKELGARGVFDDRMGMSRMSLGTYADINQRRDQDPGPSEHNSPNSSQFFVGENVEDIESSQDQVNSPHGSAAKEEESEAPTYTSDPIEYSTPTNSEISLSEAHMTQVNDSDSALSRPFPSTWKGKEKENNGPHPEPRWQYMGTSRSAANSSQNLETSDHPQNWNGRDHGSALANPTASQAGNALTKTSEPQPVPPINQEFKKNRSGNDSTEQIEISSQPQQDTSPSSSLAEDSSGKASSEWTESSNQPSVGIKHSSPMTAVVSGKNSPEKAEKSARPKLDSSPSPLAADISGNNLSEHVECSIQFNSDAPPASPSSPLTPEIIELLEKIGSLDEIIRQQQVQIEESKDTKFINPELTSDKAWEPHLECSTIPDANDSLDSSLSRNMIKLLERIGYLEELNRQQKEFLTASHRDPSDNEEEIDVLQATVSEELEVLETTNLVQDAKEIKGPIAITSSSSDEFERQKKPIILIDAVGRKYTFPFHLAATWAGIHDLILQAFLPIEVVGHHVADGHYDIVGPNGAIILPQVWETLVEPGWAITMYMWPMAEKGPLGGPPGPPSRHHFDLRRASLTHRHGHRSTGPPPGPPPSAHRGGPPPPANWPGGPPRPGPPITVLGQGGGGGGSKSKSRGKNLPRRCWDGWLENPWSRAEAVNQIFLGRTSQNELGRVDGWKIRKVEDQRVLGCSENWIQKVKWKGSGGNLELESICSAER